MRTKIKNIIISSIAEEVVIQTQSSKFRHTVSPALFDVLDKEKKHDILKLVNTIRANVLLAYKYKRDTHYVEIRNSFLF